MIIALLALAFAMIVGGSLTAFFGWDIVLIERGWTMVLAGSFSAACGALLLGITAAVSKLARIQSELARLQVGSGERVREELSLPATGLSVAALAGGLLGRDEPKPQDEAQSDLPLFANDDRLEETPERTEEPEAPKASEPLVPFPPRTRPDEAASRDETDEPELKVPDFLLAERRQDAGVEARTATADTSLFADEPVLDEAGDRERDELEREETREPRPEPFAASEAKPEPVHEAEPVPEPVLAEEEPASAEDKKKPGAEKASGERRPGATVVGTYNSGDNTYVMFSDGSIEAQTPGGVFHFGSLDELKAFIASGGESGAVAT